MKILLLEDDLILNEIISEHLEEVGNEVTTTFDGYEAEELLYSQKFDLLLFDVNIPNIDGFKLLRELRSKDIFTPAIFITSLHMVDDVEKGFNSGCDDYLKKPFELRELDIRINNIKRLFKIENNKLEQISENISIDIKNLLIIIDNKEIHITKKELDILVYLINNADIPISVDEIISNIWGYANSVSNATIRTYVKNIRKLIGEEFISNIRGVGYRFNKK